MTEPTITTEAGAELHFYLVGLTTNMTQPTETLQAIDNLILAIEDEAAADERDKTAAPSAEPYYLPMDCPVCGRRRMEWDGKVLSCEKCATSSEWDGFTEDGYPHTERAKTAALLDALEIISDGRHPDGHRGAVLVARAAIKGVSDARS